MKYLHTLPKKIPAGKILVHNIVRALSPTQKPDENGFRVFLLEESEKNEFDECSCGWSGLPHYLPKGRAKRSPTKKRKA